MKDVHFFLLQEKHDILLPSEKKAPFYWAGEHCLRRRGSCVWWRWFHGDPWMFFMNKRLKAVEMYVENSTILFLSGKLWIMYKANRWPGDGSIIVSPVSHIWIMHILVVPKSIT
jgi:hypothetical protein